MSRVQDLESRVRKLKKKEALLAVLCLECGSTGWNPCGGCGIRRATNHEACTFAEQWKRYDR